MILTLLCLFLVLVGIACLLLYRFKDGFESEGWFGTGILLTIFAGCCLFFCVIAISMKEVNAQAHIVKIDAIRETFKSARIDENIHPLELAAIQHKVAEKNEWIANAKFWTERSLTNWFWSKRILEIKPIK